MRIIHADLIRSPRVLILVAPFILMAPVWLTGKAMYWGTPSTQFIPWWWQAWQTLHSGELPLWNPLVGMGAPLLANYQSALLYSPTWIYFALAAIGGLKLMAWGQALIVAFHLAWAGWGMGLLIRRLGKSDLAQTVGGLAFGLSGYLVARAHFLSINSAVAWLPWILLMSYELILEPRNKRTIIKLAIVLAMQWLAGHAQISWYTLILAIAWTGFWGWRAGGWPSLGRSALRFGLAGLLAFGLSAAQLLPTAEYLANSQRATEVGFEQAATYSFWPWRLIGLAAPNFFGNPAHGDYWGYGNFWEDAIYVGLLPLLLAFANLKWARKNNDEIRLITFLVGTVIISFILALGSNTPLFEWLYKNIPTFALFQSPTRFTIWLVFALALMAALAVDRWKRPTGRALYWSRLAVAAAVAVLLVASIGKFLARQSTITLPQTYFSAALTMGVVGLAAALLHLRAPQNKAGEPFWGWLVAGLAASDLLFAGWGLNPGANLELYKEDATLPAELREQVGEGRLFISESDDYELRYEKFFQFDDFFIEDPELIRSVQLPNAFLMNGIPSVNNYDPLVLARYKDMMTILELSDEETRSEMLSKMSVAIIETLQPVDESVTFVSIDPLPRVRILDCHGFENSNDLDDCKNSTLASASITRESANSVDIAIDAPDGGWLVLADMVYPGWLAYAEEIELQITPADGVFRAVGMPSGQHEIKFVYQPMLFYFGSGLSLTAWLSLFLLWKRNNEK